MFKFLFVQEKNKRKPPFQFFSRATLRGCLSTMFSTSLSVTVSTASDNVYICHKQHQKLKM